MGMEVLVPRAAVAAAEHVVRTDPGGAGGGGRGPVAGRVGGGRGERVQGKVNLGHQALHDFTVGF